MMAVKTNNLPLVKKLVSLGANPLERNVFGYYGALAYVTSNDTDIIKYFIELGLDINYHESNDQTLLHRATLSNNRDLVVYLLEKGANTTPTSISLTAYEIAVMENCDEIREILEKYPR